jgi:hypothetical protein
MEARLDELKVVDPKPRAASGDVDDGTLTRCETAVDRHPCRLAGSSTGRTGLSAEYHHGGYLYRSNAVRRRELQL